VFEKILVPLDGSKVSELALPYADKLTAALGAELDLVYVCETKEKQYRHMQELYLDKIAEQTNIHLKADSRSLGTLVVSVTTRILDGDAADELISYAEKSNVSLIIMCSHGRSGAAAWAMGTVAERVIRLSGKPVLLVMARTFGSKAEAERILGKILVPLDGSAIAEASLPYVADVASKLGSKVTLLEVIDPGLHTHSVGGVDYVLLPKQEVESLKKRAKDYLADAARKLKGIKVTTRVMTGQAAKEIVRTAEKNRQMIVIGSHGGSAVSRWFAGSVTHKVLHSSRMPILLVRTKITDHEA
jgi:nucleotide-binding universal stress UspA family protein